jgi:hypothetical protein
VREGNHLEDQGVDERIILKRDFREAEYGGEPSLPDPYAKNKIGYCIIK